ncbi:sensor histidine kinase [Yeguia hominis]|uniref:Sensor histidine kinase n=1 Tax=Yeguia hominis TaxID=2763662 RepID=A0A926HT00_9FIRM|nr:sensor histidine kinase [Yeguia hominis]MBC8534365.1 sensor histidine kinase [Yeguia hominis]
MKKLSIRKKMLLLFIPLFLGSYFILAFLLMRLISTFYNTQLKNSYKDQTVILSLQINSVLDELPACALNILNDFNRNENRTLLTEPADSRLEKYMQDKKIQELLYNNLYLYPDVRSIGLCGPDLELHYTGYHMKDAWNEQAIETVKKAIYQYSTQDIWYPYEQREYLTDTVDTPVLTLGKKIISVSDAELIGYVYINLRETSMSNLFSSLEDAFTHYYVINAEGTVISATEKSLLTQKIFADLIRNYQDNVPFEYENSFVTINALSQNNLYLIGITDNAALRATSSQIYQSVFWVSGLTLLALTACIVFFSRRLSLPIEKLTNRMRHMEGIDSGVVIEHKRNCDNEIEDMNWYFSQMVKQVNISFEDLKQSEEQKRELQLSLLQDQIKPHFLYNALDAIYVMEFMEQRKEAMEATKALADFYRSALSDGEEIVTIGQEITMSTNYLMIQNFRHSNIFRYSIQVPNALYPYTIPKLTLQPIIENALYHGLREKSEGGTLYLVGNEEENYIYLTISDDGVGMDEEALRHLRTKSKSHFGLYSVDARIKLYFSPECGVTIQSELGKGTVVTVKLLKRRQEKTEDG